MKLQPQQPPLKQWPPSCSRKSVLIVHRVVNVARVVVTVTVAEIVGSVRIAVKVVANVQTAMATA